MISGDDLEQMDTMGNPGLISSRGAATCFVTTDNGRTLYSHQIFQGIGTDTGNQASGSGIGAADAAVVQEASFVIEGQDLLGVEDDYQVMVENAQVSVPENDHLSNSVSRELFPVSTGTPRQSQSARASAATVATPSVSGSRSRAGLTGSSVPQTTAALTTATDASADYFRTLSRNNTLMSRVRFLAYQSHLSVNRKREELLELQRLEQVERLNPLTTKMKSSPIFAKLLQLVPRGALSSELFEFLRYLYPFKRYTKFSFSDFFNSVRLFENVFS